jgi:hypothetical protein
MKKRTRKPEPKLRTYVASNGARLVGQDPRITDALNKLDGAVLCALSATVGVPYQGTMQHNLAIAARSATDIRGILMLGGDES